MYEAFDPSVQYCCLVAYFLFSGTAHRCSTEVLKMTGLLKDPKRRVLKGMEGYRLQVRKALTEESLQGFFKKGRMCAIGVYCGATLL